MKIVLGIETSCDETAVAIVREDRAILSNLVLSQIDTHQIYGGVVPEIAAREHLSHINPLIHAALKEAECTLNDINAIAATSGPGLIGGVIVGMMSAKTLAFSTDKPFIAVNHLEGHALTPRLTDDIAFPFLLLLISGGHTQILMCHDIGRYDILGTTRDDAVGECFDKSAKLMGLPYPGGPHLEKAALACKNPAKALKRFPLPRPLCQEKTCDFSFSGLKTAIRSHIEAQESFTPDDIADLSYAMHDAMADIFEQKLNRALTIFRAHYPHTDVRIVLSGGVSANTILNKRLKSAISCECISFYAPPLSLCGDNAAMIAWAGIERLVAFHQSDSLDFAAKPRWALDTL